MATLRRLAFYYRFSRLDEHQKVTLFDLGSVGHNVRMTGMVDFGSEPYLIHLGSDITLTSGVMFVNHDGGTGVLRGRHPGLNLYRSIRLGDRVFVGAHTIILPGVTIGSDVVIGAGSIVTRDIPSGTVAAGNPCRAIRSIEEYEQRVLREATYLESNLQGEARKQLILRSIAEREGRGR